MSVALRGAAGRRRLLMAATSALLVMALSACSGSREGMVEVPGTPGAMKSEGKVRAARRAYDGAPPVIPHEAFGIACTACHDEQGMDVPGTGFAPPSPHALTEGMSAMSRCTQCHVQSGTAALLVANEFVALRQDLRSGGRLHGRAPPTIPHKTLMRENCAACHTGPAAREEIRTSHPERTRCVQCHVPVTTLETFQPGGTMP